MKRIVVIGTSGSGKSTFARSLAKRTGTPCIELDALHWEPDWAEAPLEIFRSRVETALNGTSWIVDGNYGKVRDLIWRQAQTVVWLDYSFPVVFGRALYRTLKRAITREENGSTPSSSGVLSTRTSTSFGSDPPKRPMTF